MSGAIFETFVFAEILKSWWHRGRTPQVYYYRDKDGKEIDLVFLQDGRVYPVEVKKSASPRREWATDLSALSRLRLKIADGAVICLSKQPIPIAKNVCAIPASML